jgi:sulfite reductase (NADPH) flavoprotein alpha-component
VDLDLGDSGLSYDPGDALGVWPCNVPAAVEALLRAAGLDGGQAVPVPGWHYRDPALPPGAAPLRDVLARAYDLRSPRRGLLALLHSALQDPGRRGGAAAGCRAEAAADDGGRAHADGTGSGHAPALESPDLGQHAKARAPTRAVIHVVADAAPPAPAASPPAAAAALRQLAALVADPQATEAYLRPRHVADVLRDWAPPGALTAGELLIVLRPLAPRLYSISSSPLESPGRVQVTVAVVRYESLGAERLGVCSTWLGERRAAGQSSLVFVSRSPDFRLPPSLGTPLIMVGPGTGVAPFRAFTQHRLLQAASNGGGAPGQTVLFFGSRRRDQDFLYGDALEAWAAGGQLSLFTAFSREAGGPKVYVQQRVREQGSLVWALLQEGAHVYVCGDATRMAGDVDAALLEVVAARLEGGARQGAARAYLDELAAAGRYQRDVWF